MPFFISPFPFGTAINRLTLIIQWKIHTRLRLQDASAYITYALFIMFTVLTYCESLPCDFPGLSGYDVP